MYDSEMTHPLLAQIPLTVSPFISLPTATTLPYTFKSLPSSLPPSVIVDSNGSQTPKYVVSSSGHAAHPAELLASYQALTRHMELRQAERKATIAEWEESIKQRELAEKRRLAPGWLDREEKLLQPTHQRNISSDAQRSLLDHPSADLTYKDSAPAIEPRNEGDELDRAFGVLKMK
ncbi:hypothetical protein FQN57_007238 [Myotisia sp. PD_48]|nr:hypothetical protein FQN57_007238 [Myotisia sp. PD_48]